MHRAPTLGSWRRSGLQATDEEYEAQATSPERYAQSDPISCGLSGYGSEVSAARGQSHDVETHSGFRYRMIGEEAFYHLAQPLPLLGNRMVHTLSQFVLDFPQSGSHPVTT